MTTTQGLSTLRSSALTFHKNRPKSGPARLAGESVKWRNPWWVWPGIQSVNLHGLTEPLFACKHFKSPKSHSFYTAFNLCQAVRQAHSVWSQESWENLCAGSKGPSESDWKTEQVLKAQTVMLKGHHCIYSKTQNMIVWLKVILWAYQAQRFPVNFQVRGLSDHLETKLCVH